MPKVAGFVRSLTKYAWMHKKQTAIFLVLLLVILFFLRPKKQVTIDAITVGKHNLVQTVSVSGSVDATSKADLSFLTSGQLVFLGTQKNGTVTAGQTIAQIDSRTVEKNLQTALLTYSEQRNTYDQTIANNNNINNPGDALSDSVKRILQNNQYDLQKSINSVELQDLARQQSFLVSPINGIITRQDALSVGTTVLPTTVFEVVDPSSLVFNMDVDEADIGKVQVGQRVKIALDAYPNDSLELPINTIDYMSHVTSNGATAYSVKVKLPTNDIARFRLGLSGDAEITTAQKDNALTIPLSSIFNDNYVYLKTSKGYKQQRVTFGLQNDIDTEVLSGLTKGDIVVVQPSKVPQNQIVQ